MSAEVTVSSPLHGECTLTERIVFYSPQMVCLIKHHFPEFQVFFKPEA